MLGLVIYGNTEFQVEQYGHLEHFSRNIRSYGEDQSIIYRQTSGKKNALFKTWQK